MKATGIIRKIDDLGRIVIPKEIRRAMRIREGDPLEIYTSRDGEVIFKKYSMLASLEDFSPDLCETLSRSTGLICAVVDRDTVLCVSGGGKRELPERRISSALEQLLAGKSLYRSASGTPVPVIEGAEKFLVLAAAPIVSEDGLAGALVLAGTDPAARADDAACTLLQGFAAFLGKHLSQ